MERLTEKISEYIQCNNNECRLSYCDRECEHYKRMVNKLAEYEDAEEQGLLLRLPCRMGDTLYQPIYSNIYDYKVTGLYFDIVRNKWMLEVSYEINDEWYKTTCNFESIGKTVFLTKEEAEQALEQMKAGE